MSTNSQECYVNCAKLFVKSLIRQICDATPRVVRARVHSASKVVSMRLARVHGYLYARTTRVATAIRQLPRASISFLSFVVYKMKMRSHVCRFDRSFPYRDFFTPSVRVMCYIAFFAARNRTVDVSDDKNATLITFADVVGLIDFNFR